VSGGSESSIDVSHLTMLLANMSHPTSNLAYTRARTRVRGHRRRISQARASRSSIIETIEEEQSVNLGLASHLTSISASPAPAALAPAFDLSVADKSIVVVDSDADSRRSSLEWDPNHGLSLRRYHALKHEATDAVEESKRVWSDTPFSLFALQG
jgi:serine/arginine repetitive matrix protein 2